MQSNSEAVPQPLSTYGSPFLQHIPHESFARVKESCPFRLAPALSHAGDAAVKPDYSAKCEENKAAVRDSETLLCTRVARLPKLQWRQPWAQANAFLKATIWSSDGGTSRATSKTANRSSKILQWYRMHALDHMKGLDAEPAASEKRSL
eukprot:6172865-Pleurochrysis_carterae.AAC.2